MECTANNVDQKDCLTFVSSVPNVVRQFAVPDDNRLILGIAQPSVKAAGVRLLREAGATQSERPFEQSTTGYLLPEDGRHLVNVDAHSAEARHSRSISPTINESVIAGDNTGVYQIRLVPGELLSKIRNEPTEDPVTFKNHAADSAICEVTLVGLHVDKKYLSIVDFNIAPQHLNNVLFHRELLYVSVRVKIPGVHSCDVVGSVISYSEGKVHAVLNDILLHMQVFYCKAPFIELQVELFDSTTHDRPQPSSPYANRVYCTPSVVTTTVRPLVMAVVPDDDRIMLNLPLDTSAPPPSEASSFYHVGNGAAVNDHDDSQQAEHSMQFTTEEFNAEELAEMSSSEQNSFSILLDGEKLYSIIKSKKIQLYPSNFKLTMRVDENILIPIVMKILPHKSEGRYVSIWAEIATPIEQSFAAGEVTIEAAAFNPHKDRDYGRLGNPVRHTELLSMDKLNAVSVVRKAVVWRITLEKVMLEMQAFYCQQVQIDIKTKWNRLTQ